MNKNILHSGLCIMLFLAVFTGLLFTHGTAQAAGDKAVKVESKSDTAESGTKIEKLWKSTGLNAFIQGFSELGKKDSNGKVGLPLGIGQILMILVGCLLIFLAINYLR